MGHYGAVANPAGLNRSRVAGLVIVPSVLVGLLTQNLLAGLLVAAGISMILSFILVGWVRRRSRQLQLPRTSWKEAHADQFAGRPLILRVLLSFRLRLCVFAALVACMAIRDIDAILALTGVLAALYLAMHLNLRWGSRLFGGSSAQQ
jgi:hypothetical protein